MLQNQKPSDDGFKFLEEICVNAFGMWKGYILQNPNTGVIRFEFDAITNSGLIFEFDRNNTQNGVVKCIYNLLDMSNPMHNEIYKTIQINILMQLMPSL